MALSHETFGMQMSRFAVRLKRAGLPQLHCACLTSLLQFVIACSCAVLHTVQHSFTIVHCCINALCMMNPSDYMALCSKCTELVHDIAWYF